MPAPPAIGAKLSVENYGRRPEPPRHQDDYEYHELVLAHCGPPLPAAHGLQRVGKGRVKGLLSTQPHAYSPECVEGEYSEVRGDGVLRSSSLSHGSLS